MKQNNFAEKVKKMALVAILCMIIIIPVSRYNAQPATTPSHPNFPKPPSGSQAFNLTEIIPHGYRHTIQSGVPSILRFQNMNLEVDSSKTINLNITVGHQVANHYLALDLRPGEILNITIEVDVNPPTEIIKHDKDIGYYLTVKPNTSEPVNSSIKLYIHEEALENQIGRKVIPWALTWAYWNGSRWTPVESWLDEEGYLVTYTNHFSTWTITETGRPIPTPSTPGIPPLTEAHNYSKIVPSGFTWQVREREPVFLVFRNLSMMINSSGVLDLNLSSVPYVANHVLALDIDPGGALSLKINIDIAPPSGVMRMTKDIGLYFDIESNSTAMMDARLKLLINETMLETQLGRDINVSGLRWAYWEDGEWIPVDSVIDENSYLNARTSHFSIWTIAELSTIPRPTPVDPPDIPGIPPNAIAYEFTETVPRGFEWHVERGKPTVLSFNNFVLMVEPGESLSLNISVDASVSKQVFSLQLAPGESLDLDLKVSNVTPSGIVRHENDIELYFDIESNISTTSEASLGLLIDEADIVGRTGRAVDPSKLSWAYWDGEGWAEVESVLDSNGFLSAETSHFSTWTVLEMDEEPIEPTPRETPWTLYGGVLIIVVIILAYIFTKRK